MGDASLTTPPTPSFGTQPGRVPGEVDPDSDLEGLDLGEPGTPLDDLAKELTQDVALEPLWLPVPGRPGYEAGFERDIDSDLLQRWTKAAQNKKLAGGGDQMQIALRVLARANLGLRRHGEQIVDHGSPLTFRSERFLALYGFDRPQEAIKKFYGRDGDVVTTANEVLEGAGYTGDLEEAASAGPTQRR